MFADHDPCSKSLCDHYTSHRGSHFSLTLADNPYDVVNLNIFSTLEPSLGIVNACLPVFQPALAKIHGRGSSAWTYRPIRPCMTPYTWPSVHYGHPHDPSDSAKHRFRRFRDPGNLLNNDVTNNYGRAGTPCSSDQHRSSKGGTPLMAQQAKGVLK
jgi:hypothetical protein